MPDIYDSSKRGVYSRAVIAAADRLRDDVAHARVPWSEQVLHVGAGEEGDVEPTEIVVMVTPGYLGVVGNHFASKPIDLGASTEPEDGEDTAPEPFGHAELTVFAATSTTVFVPPDLDPASMIGRDVDDAAVELGAAGWSVRPIADGDAITLDYHPGRANLHYRDDGRPEGHKVYKTSIG